MPSPALTLRAWQASALDLLTATPPQGAVVRAIMGAGKSVVIGQLVAHYAKQGWAITVTCPTQMLVEQLWGTISREARCMVGMYYEAVHSIAPCTVVCHASLDAYEDEYTRRAALLAEAGIVVPRLWIADECHSTESNTVIAWREAASVDASVGFTATPYRAESSDTLSLWEELVVDYGVAQALADGIVVPPTLHHVTADVSDEYADEYTASWVAEQYRAGRACVANAADIADADAFTAQLVRAGVPAIAVHSRSPHGYSEARAALRARSGCVVYVNMLAEGFDAPEIEAMALRRKVGSRVRFAQEVGRGLRAAPGKTTCHQLDVYDLYGEHQLSWEESLGVRPPKQPPIPALVLDAALREQAENRHPPVVLDAVRSWLRAELVGLSMRTGTRRRPSRGAWRRDEITAKQLRYVAVLLRGLPREATGDAAPRLAGIWREMKRPDTELRRGEVSDFINLIKAYMGEAA